MLSQFVRGEFAETRASTVLLRAVPHRGATSLLKRHLSELSARPVVASCHFAAVEASNYLMSQLRQARFSVLDLAPVKSGGDIAESFRNTLDLAQHVERWGYTRFWLAEHHNMPGIASAATSVLIGYVAGGTSTLRVGSGGIMLPNHAPLVIAEHFGTLETLYPGRIDLGVGRAPGTDGLTARALRRGLQGEDEFPRQVAELLAYLAPVQPGQRLQAVPGAGTNVPVWLLGSSTFSAQLAAMLGLPFAFASHFAPEMLLEAIQIYRSDFKPSRFLEKSYVMAGLPLVAADTDAEAKRLATSGALRFLKLIRGEPIFTPPPVATMDGVWSEPEKAMVQSKLRVAVVGGPETVERKLVKFLRDTQADELIFTSDVYDHAARLRSFEIAATVMKDVSRDVELLSHR
jgi:luciferase family oxidoreductase group 1